MLFGPSVSLSPPDATAWRQAYPEGLGASAFSSPGFQSLMHGMLGEAWEPRLVSVDGSDLLLPALGQQDRFGRWVLRVHPIGYDVMPIQRARLSQRELDRWVDALCSPKIRHFVWWLPSWHTDGLRVQPRKTLTGEVSVGEHITYVIPFAGDVDAHLSKHVSSTMRRYARRNIKHGVTVTDDPTEAQLDEYIAIYERSYRDNGWEGDKFTPEFFRGVTELQKGGSLAVVLHQDRVIGGGVLMFDPNAAHYFQGAIDRDVKGVHPHVALYMHTLKCAATRGISHVNLGSINEGNEGLKRFKTSWGAEPTSWIQLSFTSGPRRTLEALRERLPRPR